MSQELSFPSEVDFGVRQSLNPLPHDCSHGHMAQEAGYKPDQLKS